MTQINNGQKICWLLNEGQMPNMDPVSPRKVGYKKNIDGLTWYVFAKKLVEHYYPLGDIEFINNSPHPIYSTMVNLNFVENGDSNLILDFNAHNC